MSIRFSEKPHCTSLSCIHLINKIASAIDRHETTAGVFLDLSKAFDTIDHQILFGKLEHYGIRGLALEWIKSYFSCRQQFVQFNSTCSSKQTIKCGVPQGSILGPLFFILHINDLPHASQLTQPLLFADDTSIFYSHSDPKRVQSVLNDELCNYDIWLKCNKLSVNIKKTNYIIFKPRQRIANHDFKAPAKRSQHANTTYRNIVGRNMLCSFGHHVATCWVLLAQV